MPSTHELPSCGLRKRGEDGGRTTRPWIFPHDEMCQQSRSVTGEVRCLDAASRASESAAEHAHPNLNHTNPFKTADHGALEAASIDLFLVVRNGKACQSPVMSHVPARPSERVALNPKPCS